MMGFDERPIEFCHQNCTLAGDGTISGSIALARNAAVPSVRLLQHLDKLNAVLVARAI
jgi:hypothetical protein